MAEGTEQFEKAYFYNSYPVLKEQGFKLAEELGIVAKYVCVSEILSIIYISYSVHTFSLTTS